MAAGSGVWDVAIVGAGPAGLATAWAAKQAGLSAVVFDRGCVADNIRRYPANLTFYSTPRLIELGDLPLITMNAKPTRTEAVMYYTRFAQAKGLAVRTYHLVETIRPVDLASGAGTPEAAVAGSDGAAESDGAAGGEAASGAAGDRAAPGFELVCRSHVGVATRHRARAVVLAFGAYDVPNALGVPGEDLPHVSHFYDEAERYHGQRVLIVGGKGSASEAALEVWRAGGQVTLSYRRPEFSGLKYWVQPDLENRIAEGSIEALMPSWVVAIRTTEVDLKLGDGSLTTRPIDFVLALTGYAPQRDLFDQLGVAYDVQVRPRIDPVTHESNVPGIYVAGCICAGNVGNEIFIENGRTHGAPIIAHLAERLRGVAG